MEQFRLIVIRKCAWRIMPVTYGQKLNILQKRFSTINEFKFSPKCFFLNNNFYDSSYISIIVRGYAKRSQGKPQRGGKVKTALLTDEELADIINISHYHRELNEAAEKLKQDFFKHMSIHSIAGSIDTLIVNIEDGEYPLNELAQISKKNPSLIAINMAGFPEGLKPVLQAINESGMGINPQQEGTMLYLPVPKITREHRENMAKNAKSLFVKAKEEVRHIQNYYVKEAKNKTDLSEDLVHSAVSQIMGIAEQCVISMEKVMKLKQQELLGES